MKKNIRLRQFRKALLIISLFGFVQYSKAQFIKAEISTGAAEYHGDLNQSIPHLKEIKGSLSLGVSADVGDRMRLRLRYTTAQISGDDRYSSRADFRARNLNFFSNISELSFLYEYDLGSKELNKWVPYVFSGIGYFRFNPKTYDTTGTRIVELATVGTEGQFLKGNPKGKGQTYSLDQINIQTGVGIRCQISDNFDIGAEFCYRFLFTDYLDDVHSSFYVNKSAFDMNNPAERLAYRLSYRGARTEDDIVGKDMAGQPKKFNYANPRGLNNNDGYSTFQIRANIRLGFVNSGGKYGFYSTKRFF